MESIKKLIREIISKHLKKEDKCNCGCHTCENVGNPGVLINESLNKKTILSENLRYHVDNKLPLTENTFRYGSEAFLNLWAEARYLYVREAIHVNEDDKEILEETNLGEYGMYEGVKVPLDLPMIEEEVGDETDIENAKGVTLMPYSNLIQQLKDLYKQDSDSKHKQMFAYIHDELVDAAMNRDQDRIDKLLRKYNNYLPVGLNEEKNPPLNKPKRGGSKKFYVYVKNPKTKKIKKVSFGGTTGLSVKINDPKARQAFAKRHRCSEKTDRTKPSYWSCRIGRYWKQLGGEKNFSGYW
jgi:hypothetical protein